MQSSVYYVRSDTDRDHYYLVTTDDRGLLKCECKSNQYRCGGEKVVAGRFGAWCAYKCRVCRTLTQQFISTP